MKKRFGFKSALLVTLLVVAAVVAILELTNTTHWFHAAKTTDDSGINYGPPTKAEIKDSESRKSNPPSTDTDSTDTQSGTAKKKVGVEITTFAQKSSTLDVNGFASGVVESGGTCTLTLTSASNSSIKVAQSRSSEANATNTTCGVISVPLSKLSAGTWNAVLSYSSSTSTGISDVTPIEVRS